MTALSGRAGAGGFESGTEDGLGALALGVREAVVARQDEHAMVHGQYQTLAGCPRSLSGLDKFCLICTEHPAERGLQPVFQSHRPIEHRLQSDGQTRDRVARVPAGRSGVHEVDVLEGPDLLHQDRKLPGVLDHDDQIVECAAVAGLHHVHGLNVPPGLTDRAGQPCQCPGSIRDAATQHDFHTTPRVALARPAPAPLHHRALWEARPEEARQEGGKVEQPVVAVIGAGDPDLARSDPLIGLAEGVGAAVAEAGALLYCGGLGGVMAAACRGAKAAGGTTVGILPGADRSAANPWVDLAIATGLGEARNLVLIRSADALVAVGGGFGTLSEIGFARKLGRPVIGLQTWTAASEHGPAGPLVTPASDPASAVGLALQLAGL